MISKDIFLVDKEISRCANSLYVVNNGNWERHRKRVKRGKLLLKLLSTIGRPDIFFWLDTAGVEGNFYCFKEFKIVKKNTQKKEVIDLKEINSVFKNSKELQGIGNSDFLKLMKEFEGFSYEKTEYLLLALNLLASKMSNIMYSPKYQVGEIYRLDDISIPAKNVSLINLYQYQVGLKTEEEAIEELAAKPYFNIPEDIFEPVDINWTTRWKERCVKIDSEIFERNHDYEYIEFRDRNQLLGNVMIDAQGIVAPQTFWSKNLNYPGRPLEIPFSQEVPLWNQNLIQEYGEKNIVILTDSLCAAYRAYSGIMKSIKLLERKLSDLNQKNNFWYYGGSNKEFDEELLEYITKTLEKKYSRYADEMEKQRINFKGVYHFAINVFRSRGAGIISIINGEVENNNKNLSISVIAMKRHAGLVSSCYSDFHKELNAVKYLSNKEGYKSYFSYNNIFKIFQEAYSLIHAYIKEKQDEDNREIRKLEFELTNLKRIIWSSWYGGEQTLRDVNWSVLKKQKVFYVIRTHDKYSYKTALKVNLAINNNFDFLVFIDYDLRRRKQIAEIQRGYQKRFILQSPTFNCKYSLWGKADAEFFKGADYKFKLIPFDRVNVISKSTENNSYKYCESSQCFRSSKFNDGGEIQWGGKYEITLSKCDMGSLLDSTHDSRPVSFTEVDHINITTWGKCKYTIDNYVLNDQYECLFNVDVKNGEIYELEDCLEDIKDMSAKPYNYPQEIEVIYAGETFLASSGDKNLKAGEKVVKNIDIPHHMSPATLKKYAEREFGLYETNLEENINITHKETLDCYDPSDDEKLPENKFLLEPLIREKSISLLYSEPGVGKSWISLAIANSLLYACPTFLPGMGWKAVEPKRVLLIDSEMSVNSFKKRLRILDQLYMTMSKSIGNTTSPDKLFYKLVAHKGWNLTDEEGETVLKSQNG